MAARARRRGRGARRDAARVAEGARRDEAVVRAPARAVAARARGVPRRGGCRARDRALRGAPARVRVPRARVEEGRLLLHGRARARARSTSRAGRTARRCPRSSSTPTSSSSAHRPLPRAASGSTVSHVPSLKLMRLIPLLLLLLPRLQCRHRHRRHCHCRRCHGPPKKRNKQLTTTTTTSVSRPHAAVAITQHAGTGARVKGQTTSSCASSRAPCRSRRRRWHASRTRLRCSSSSWLPRNRHNSSHCHHRVHPHRLRGDRCCPWAQQCFSCSLPSCPPRLSTHNISLCCKFLCFERVTD